jgi:hypothetical protein
MSASHSSSLRSRNPGFCLVSVSSARSRASSPLSASIVAVAREIRFFVWAFRAATFAA